MNLSGKSILMLLCFCFVSFSINAQTRELPPAFEAMEHYSDDDMKELPDLKVHINVEVDEGFLNNRTEVELKILRNSIFAQYGRSFNTPWLSRYFNSRAWYKEGKFNDKMLTKTDRKNVRLIKRFENKLSQKEKDIIEMSYCEREESYSMERFVFSKNNQLIYETGSVDGYGRMYNKIKKAGLWATAFEYIYYKLDDESSWEVLEFYPLKKTCL